MNDITAPLSPGEAANVKQAAWYEDRIIVPLVASAPARVNIWQTIVDAMKENRVIAFADEMMTHFRKNSRKIYTLEF